MIENSQEDSNSQHHFEIDTYMFGDVRLLRMEGTGKFQRNNYVRAPILDSVVYCTGLCGGDAGHGGEVAIELSNATSMVWGLEVTCHKRSGRLKNIVLMARGDHEMKNLMEAFRDAAKYLEERINEEAT